MTLNDTPDMQESTDKPSLQASKDAPPPPTAVRAPRKKVWWGFWFLPLIAIGLAAYMVTRADQEQGPTIEVHFRQGHGLKPGGSLRFRDIDVGRVESVLLSPDMENVRVTIRLQPDAVGLARKDSQFWIVRPQISLSGGKGLDTVIGGKYIQVIPGTDPTPQGHFTGMEEPPLQETPSQRGLTIHLLAASADSLRPGAPVTFRDIPVGVITDLHLLPDHSKVAIEAEIEDAHRNLITPGTKFWRRGAASVRGGIFRGMTFELGSVEQMMLGGVSLSLPNDPEATPGPAEKPYILHEDPEKEWLEWLEIKWKEPG